MPDMDLRDAFWLRVNSQLRELGVTAVDDAAQARLNAAIDVGIRRVRQGEARESEFLHAADRIAGAVRLTAYQRGLHERDSVTVEIVAASLDGLCPLWPIC